MHILHILKHDIFKSTIPSYEYCYTQQYAYNSTTHDGFKEFYAQMMCICFSAHGLFMLTYWYWVCLKANRLHGI